MRRAGIVASRLVVSLGIVAGPICSNVAADPLTFSNVRAAQAGVLPIDLFSTPDAVLTSGTHVSFFVSIEGRLEPEATDTLRLTFDQPGGLGTVSQEFGIPAFGTIFPPLTVVLGQDFPIFFHPVPVDLTVDLLQSSPDYVIPGGPLAGEAVDSHRFSFSVVQPIPEPTTVGLVGIGLGATVLHRLRRRRDRV